MLHEDELCRFLLRRLFGRCLGIRLCEENLWCNIGLGVGLDIEVLMGYSLCWGIVYFMCLDEAVIQDYMSCRVIPFYCIYTVGRRGSNWKRHFYSGVLLSFLYANGVRYILRRGN